MTLSLPVGRWISIVAIALMVLAILIQVFFRYVLNSALPWPDEAARFMMLWLTGLDGADCVSERRLCCHRHGGAGLPLKLGQLVSLFFSLSRRAFWPWRSALAGARSPVLAANSRRRRFICRLALIQRVVAGAAVLDDGVALVGVVLLFIVNVELILRSLITYLGGGDSLKDLMPPEEEIMAE